MSEFWSQLPKTQCFLVKLQFQVQQEAKKAIFVEKVVFSAFLAPGIAILLGNIEFWAIASRTQWGT